MTQLSLTSRKPSLPRPAVPEEALSGLRRYEGPRITSHASMDTIDHGEIVTLEKDGAGYFVDYHHPKTHKRLGVIGHFTSSEIAEGVHRGKFHPVNPG